MAATWPGMPKTMPMTRNQNHDDDDDATSRKIIKTCDYGPWSDLNHHLLFIVMMQLGVVDSLSFSGVCKSWRSLTISNRNTFMASKPPMSIRICWRTRKKPCYLEDFEGRKFKTILPHYAGGACVGLTCGYLIFFKRTTCDFWLVNPITRHELYFRDYLYPCTQNLKAILVFSLSLCGWVLVVLHKFSRDLWFSVAGSGVWNHVLYTSFIIDVRSFKGKIYTLNENPSFNNSGEICELKLNRMPKLTLLETKNSLKPSRHLELVSSGDNLYVMDYILEDRYRLQELDFGEMKWVSREKKIGESEFFLSNLKNGVAVETECGVRRQGLLVGHNAGDLLRWIEVEKATSFGANMWYFPHECLNVDLIDE